MEGQRTVMVSATCCCHSLLLLTHALPSHCTLSSPCNRLTCVAPLSRCQARRCMTVAASRSGAVGHCFPPHRPSPPPPPICCTHLQSFKLDCLVQRAAVCLSGVVRRGSEARRETERQPLSLWGKTRPRVQPASSQSEAQQQRASCSARDALAWYVQAEQ